MNQTMPKPTNPRSVLHALQPMGLGTGDVESLLSYLCRLAVSHSTSTLSLSRAVAQRFEYDVEEQFDWFHRNLSGLGESALTWSGALSALTSVPHLEQLTFQPWGNVIATNGLPIVSKGQFCALCLEEDKASGEAPYFRLAWESKSVSVCHKHHVHLTRHCPSCGKENVRHAAALVVPGWCTKCGSFLGEHDEPSDAASPIAPVELWRARQIHELLQSQQRLKQPPERQVLIDAIQHIIGEMDGGQSARFAKRVGLSKSTVHYWLQAGKTPTLEASLQVAAQSGMSLTKLLTGDVSDWKAPEPGRQMALALFKQETKPRPPQRVIDWTEVEAQLQKFLALPTPISVHEAARRLGIEARMLYLGANEPARQIGERWLAFCKRRKQTKLNEAMPHLVAAGLDARREGRAINLREMTARVPPEILSGVNGLYGVLEEVRARVETRFVAGDNT